MAFAHLKTPTCFLLSPKLFCLNCTYRIPSTRPPQLLVSPKIRTTCDDAAKAPALTFETSSVTQFAVSEEIQFYRHCGNGFSQMTFSNPQEPYGPPLAIMLPWKGLSEDTLKKFVEFYGEKGFDVLTLSLQTNQLMFPCTAGHAMNVVTDFLQYLKGTHKHRPYIFHGFSIGAYLFGEIMAQFSDQYDSYKEIANNVKGCLWDSPVDFLTVKSHVGKFLYPKNWMKRWRCNREVRNHFKKHHYDSVSYWLRSRESFCNPIIKVPNVFFVSYTDELSNPTSLQCVQKILECNGIPIFQKTYWDSSHSQHFEKYCYEYLYAMALFFNLSNLYPDENGKYKSSFATASLTNLRLSKRARDSFCE